MTETPQVSPTPTPTPPADPDQKLKELVAKFGQDLAALVGKRDLELAEAQVAAMEAFFRREPPKPEGKKASPTDAELKRLVTQFGFDLHSALAERDGAVGQLKLALLKEQFLHPPPPQLFRPPKLASPRKTGGPLEPGRQRAASPPKSCPIPDCGVENMDRRHGYLCPTHRTPENFARLGIQG